MNILWLSWRDIKNPDAGGAEKVAIEIAKRAVINKHTVTIFTSSFKSSKPKERVSKVKIIRKGNKVSCRFFAFLHYIKNRRRYHIIIDEVNTLPFLTPLFAKKKSVCLIHQLARKYWFSNLPQPLSTIGFLLENLYLMIYKDVPTITVSKSTEKDLKVLGFKNIKIIREGLNFKPVYPKLKENLILFIGRLTPQKGPVDAIYAFKTIHSKLPQMRLVIIGKGQEKYVRYLKSIVKKCRLTKSVNFKGFISEVNKISLLKKAKIILIPSVREGWCLVATEANACNCIPVGYNVPGLRDSIKNNKTGLLTNNNPKDLARASTSILSDERHRNIMLNAGFINSLEFNWENTFLDFNKIISRVYEKQ